MIYLFDNPWLLLIYSLFTVFGLGAFLWFMFWLVFLRPKKRKFKRYRWRVRALALKDFIQRKLRRFNSGYDPKMEDWLRRMENERRRSQ